MTTAGMQAHTVGYGQPVTQTEVPKDNLIKTHATKRRRAARKITARVGDTDLDQRTVSVSLPLETYNWFEERATKAPYEPTLAKYLQWELRELEKTRRAAMSGTSGQTRVDSNQYNSHQAV